jgi:hypothetical protein
MLTTPTNNNRALQPTQEKTTIFSAPKLNNQITWSQEEKTKNKAAKRWHEGTTGHNEKVVSAKEIPVGGIVKLAEEKIVIATVCLLL